MLCFLRWSAARFKWQPGARVCLLCSEPIVVDLPSDSDAPASEPDSHREASPAGTSPSDSSASGDSSDVSDVIPADPPTRRTR